MAIKQKRITIKYNNNTQSLAIEQISYSVKEFFNNPSDKNYRDLRKVLLGYQAGKVVTFPENVR